jgi:peptidoglycan/xylan/chitin deacetylase (PgdA/CDA1 family)
VGSECTEILMLHRIIPAAPVAFGLPDCYRIRGTALTVSELECVLDDAGPILPLETLERALKVGEAAPVGTVLTFDDGYREHLDVVAPLLHKRGATATFYVATGLHGDGGALAPVDAWYWLLDRAELAEAAVPMPGGGVFRGRVDSLAGKTEWVTGPPKAAMLAAGPAERGRMMEALAESVGVWLPPDLARKLYLTREDWRSLAALGMRVGAHSASHPRLTQVDDAELDREVGESVGAIAEFCSPVAFAYPDGAFDERVVGRLRAAGVASAVTCDAGTPVPGANRLKLPRHFAIAPSYLLLPHPDPA